MTHLTVTEIIDFISFDDLNEENMKLAERVNKHMIECPVCRKKICDIDKTINKIMGSNALIANEPGDFKFDDDIISAVSDFFTDE